MRCVYESNLVTRINIFPPSYSIDDSKDLHTNLDLEEDVYNIISETYTQMAKLKQNCVFATVIAQVFMQAARLLLLNSPLVMMIWLPAIKQSTDYVSWFEQPQG